MTECVQERHDEISPQKFGSDGMNKVRLNVGGQKHETYLSTVGHLPDTRLYWIIDSVIKSPDYDPETTEVFFDRHPGVFAQILNYYRTGKLHCPTDVCGPLFEQELVYWGIDEKDMEPCCWSAYTQHRDAEANLKNVLYEATSEDPIEDSSPVGQTSAAMRLYRKVRPQIWTILDESRSSNRAKIFSFTSVLFILVSVVMFCLNTLPELKDSNTWRYYFNSIEIICAVWFTLEFVLRIVFCPNKSAFACSWTTWIDFLAVAPFYLKFVVRSHMAVINALLVIRLLRLLRFFRLIYGLQVLSHTLKASSYELFLLLFMLLIPVILFSSIVYYVEQSLDGSNSKFRSIPHSFWWSLITITTVGYGDMHPVSWLGKIFGSMCAICGVVIVALPVSIIGSNFTLFYTHAQARLKLPKKKNMIFLETVSTVYSSKNFRRKAVRRKNPSRASDSYSVAYDDRRCSSKVHVSTNSSVLNDEARLSGLSSIGKRVTNKRLSSISVQIPMQDLTPGRDINSDQKHLENSFGVKSFSSPDKSPLLDSLKVDYVSEGDFDGIFPEELSSKEKNVRFSGSGNAPEITPLLVQGEDLDVNSNEGDGSRLEHEETLSAASQHDLYVGQQSHVDSSNDYLPERQANDDSDVEINVDVLQRDNPEASPFTPCRRNKQAVNGRRRDSGLESISETYGNKTRARHNNPIIEDATEDLSDNDPPCLEIPFGAMHFNPRRRQSIF